MKVARGGAFWPQRPLPRLPRDARRRTCLASFFHTAGAKVVCLGFFFLGNGNTTVVSSRQDIFILGLLSKFQCLHGYNPLNQHQNTWHTHHTEFLVCCLFTLDRRSKASELVRRGLSRKAWGAVACDGLAGNRFLILRICSECSVGRLILDP